MCLWIELEVGWYRVITIKTFYHSPFPIYCPSFNVIEYNGRKKMWGTTWFRIYLLFLLLDLESKLGLYNCEKRDNNTATHTHTHIFQTTQRIIEILKSNDRFISYLFAVRLFSNQHQFQKNFLFSPYLFRVYVVLVYYYIDVAHSSEFKKRKKKRSARDLGHLN